MNRRNLLKTTLLGAAAFALRPAFAAMAPDDALISRLAALERQHGGRLGVAMLDTGTGRMASHRGDQRFLMCSTFKLFAVGAVLARVDAGTEKLDHRVVFDHDVLLGYAPITSQHVGVPGLSVAELCAAAITVSDNTAANLLLKRLGGPSAVTAFARSIGDSVTRLDRTEPELNRASPGDSRDTTTPDAALATLQKLLLGDALSPAARAQLVTWLRGCTTGATKLRAGLPPGWSLGDKTGSGMQNETNDIGILFPPQRKPVLVTAYYAGSLADAATRDGVIAEVGRIAASM